MIKMYNVRNANISKNWRKTCYIATKKDEQVKYDEDGNEIKVYNKPEKYNFNIQPVNGYLDVTEYGEKVSRMQKTIIPYDKYLNKFKEGDIAYLDGIAPQNETEETYGMTGNYFITSVRPQNLAIAIYFEKIHK